MNVLKNCMGLCAGETVLALVDEPLRRAGEAICATAQESGAAQANLRVLPILVPSLAVVPDSFLRQVQEADVIISLLSDLDLQREHPLVRAGLAAFRAVRRGRWASGVCIDSDVLETELAADYAAVTGRTNAVASRLARAQQVRIVTPAGTDLQLELGGRPIHQDTGLLTAPGAYGNLPAGEAYLAPPEHSAEGTVVVDVSLGDIPLDRPVTLTFRNGRAVSAEGGEAAQELERRLGSDSRAWTLGELGLGTNPAVIIRGRAPIDEKAAGTAHIALGGNAHFGGTNPVATHYDCVISRPEVYLDGVRMALE
jgi:leucyl aminopeptidase (aminopeptidase T)